MHNLLPAVLNSILVATAAISVFLIGSIVLLHMRHQSRERRRERFLSEWRPLFAEYIKGSKPALPALQAEDVPTFCGLLNYWYNTMRGEALNGIREIGNAVGIDNIALNLLRAGSLSDRLLGAVVSGNLQESRAWDELIVNVSSENPIVSLTAARAVLQVDPSQGIAVVLPYCGSRSDWPLAGVASMLQMAGPTLVSDPLASQCLSSDQPHVTRFIRLLSCAQRSVAEATVRTILKTGTDPEVIAACLRQMNDVGDHDIICSYWDHPEWYVRLQAVKALARVSRGEDTPLFIRRLKDESWWVKFRAAEALAAIPSFDLFKWEQIAGKFVEPDLRRVLLQGTETRRSKLG